MITSLFTNTEVNDVDIYFRDYESLYVFAENNMSHVVSHTKKATQWITNNGANQQLELQVIHYRTFDKPNVIFENYDFTVCMGAFDFKTEEFVLHEDFLKHNSQKIIKFNSKTAYPIISAIRLDKYKNKGYYVSKAEFVRVIMTCMTLDIKSYDDLKEHLGGMYGECYDRMFEDVSDEEFDMEKVIELISNLTLSDNYFTKYYDKNYDIYEILNDLDKGEKVGLEIKGVTYRIIGNKLKLLDVKLDKLITIDEFIKGKTFYKFVEKLDDELSSYYNNKFKYVVGEIAEAVGNGKLYFNDSNSINKSTYAHQKYKALLEVAVNGSDIIDYNVDVITASKCLVLREVPVSEWVIINSNLKEYSNDASFKNKPYLF